jgi:hypothetical protein
MGKCRLRTCANDAYPQIFGCSRHLEPEAAVHRALSYDTEEGELNDANDDKVLYLWKVNMKVLMIQ